MLRKQVEPEKLWYVLKSVEIQGFCCFIFLPHLFLKVCLFAFFNFRVCLGSCFVLFSAAMPARYLPGKEAMIHSHLMTPEGNL